MANGAGSPPRPLLWAAAFAAAMGGVALLRVNGLVGEPWGSFLALGALSLVVPMVISARRKVREEGDFSPALRIYNNRALASMGLYMVAFLVVSEVHESFEPESGVMWLLALVPVIPLLGMIWAMRRYLVEETDEYLRHQAVSAALFGLGLVLVLGTVWGFLETFGLAPHIWSWWVLPAWAIGLALGQLWVKVRGA